MALFKNQILLLAILLLFMLLQFKVIWPLESQLLEYSPFAVASLLFLPHGVKAICVVLAGARAIIPLFFVHLITDLAIGLSLVHGLTSGTVSVVTMMLPLLLINFLSHKPPFEPLTLGATADLSLFRLVLVVAIISSLLNGSIGAIRYETNPLELVAFKYFTGDIGGTLVVLGLLLGLRRPLLGLARKVVKVDGQSR